MTNTKKESNLYKEIKILKNEMKAYENKMSQAKKQQTLIISDLHKSIRQVSENKNIKTRDRNTQLKTLKQIAIDMYTVESHGKISSKLVEKLRKVASRPNMNTLDRNLDTIKYIYQTKQPEKKYSIKAFNQTKKELSNDSKEKYYVYVHLEITTDHEGDLSLRKTDQTLPVYGKHNIPDRIKELIDSYLTKPYVEDVSVKNVHINKSIVDSGEYNYLGGTKDGKNKIKYFKAYHSPKDLITFDYHGLNLDKNNETELDCVPNALLKCYGDRSKAGFVRVIADGGMAYVESQLNYNKPNELDYGLEGYEDKGFTPEDILRFCSQHKIRCFGFNWKMEQFISNTKTNMKFNNDRPAFVFYFNDQHIYLIQDKEMRHSLLQTSSKSNGVISLLAKQAKKTTTRECAVDLPVDDWKTVSNTDIYITQQRLTNNIFYDFLKQGNIYTTGIKLDEKDGIVKFNFDNKNKIIYNPDYHSVTKTIETLNNHYKDEKEKFIFKNQRSSTLAKELLFQHFGGFELSMFNKMGDEIFHSDFIRNCQFNGWFSLPSSYQSTPLKYLKTKQTNYIYSINLKNDSQMVANTYEPVADVVDMLIKKEISFQQIKNKHYKSGEVDEKLIANTFNKKYEKILDFYLKVSKVEVQDTHTTKVYFDDFIYEKVQQTESKLVGYDYNKHYTDCLKGHQFGFPIYNVFDEVLPYDKKLETGYYFVETDNFLPFRGNGWYDADLIGYGLDEEIISEKDIKFQYKSSNELKSDYFHKFIELVYKLFDNPKHAINTMIGTWGHDFKFKNNHHFTSDARNVCLELSVNPNVKVKQVYHKEFSENNETIDIAELDINSHIRTDKPLCFHLYDENKVKFFNNSLPFFYKIYNISAIKIHQLSQKLGGKVRGVFTDTIVIENPTTVPKCDAKTIGGIREVDITKKVEALNENSYFMSTEPRQGLFELTKTELVELTDFKMSDNFGVFICGEGSILEVS